MEITREILEADKKVYLGQMEGLRMTISYIDGLIAFMSKQDVPPPNLELSPAPEPDVEKVTEGDVLPEGEETGC